VPFDEQRAAGVARAGWRAGSRPSVLMRVSRISGISMPGFDRPRDSRLRRRAEQRTRRSA
jgi:hypothetical protein